MQQYFDYHYNGPAFELFGTGHLISLAIVLIGSNYMYTLRKSAINLLDESRWSDTIFRNTRKSGRPE